MPKSVRISLANKCQLLFGAAVILILTSALAVGFVRMQTLVREGQEETSRELARAWMAHMIQPAQTASPQSTAATRGLVMTLIPKDQFLAAAGKDPFLARAIARFKSSSSHNEVFRTTQNPKGELYYRFAQAVRSRRLPQIPEHGEPPPPSDPPVPKSPKDSLEKVLLIQFPGDLAQRQLMLNRIYIIAAGLLAGLLAIGAFWFITTRIILSPVRVLRDTAAKVSQGDLNIRSDINTGDEFEQMSDMFNTMLENLKHNQDKLHSVNKSLDLKLGELAETNVSLYEANEIKGKFLANVSHEFRTPLNSIIGFAEVLGESLRIGDGPIDEKRKRYIDNILTSSRQLLDLINDLLDLAKIEAGRIELHLAPLSIDDTAEGLMNLMRPQAEKRDITLKPNIQRDIPIVNTDAGKLQQILFNFLSNAIKFTPPGGTVTLSAKLLPLSQPQSNGEEKAKDPLVCISVSDTGPGIPIDQQEQIFEKFIQLDSTVTREHGGTGLGLTISRELADLLQGRIELVSDTECGATFNLIIPLVLESKSAQLMPDLADNAVSKNQFNAQ